MRLQQAGFGLIEALVAVAALSIAVTTSMSLIKISNNASADVSLALSLQVIRANVINAIRDDQAWYNTSQDVNNAAMACLRGGTDCAGQGGDIVLRDSANNILYDARMPTSGFDGQGVQCSGYDDVNGNYQCPIHLNLTWQSICNSSPCVNPTIVVTAQFKVMTSEGIVTLNMNRFSFTLTRNRMTCAPQATVPMPLIMVQSALMGIPWWRLLAER